MTKLINNYELLETLGQGGMGVVYKARHIHFDEIYAIKRLWEQFNANDMVLKLFLNEAKILRKLDHKNIVHVFDVFNLENQYYIVMEYVKGRSLDEIIKKEVGPIHKDRAVNLFKQMLEGVAYIHSQTTPIIHRDIKPLNLLVMEDETVKITDFGIAKVLDTQQIASTVLKGTPVYMSPEQIINPGSVDKRTDVYSLGMTFYEMLCGKTPFTKDISATPTAIYAAIMDGDLPLPSHYYHGIPEELSKFVMKAIHKDKNQRFADAIEMSVELNKLAKNGISLSTDDQITGFIEKDKLSSTKLDLTPSQPVQPTRKISVNRKSQLIVMWFFFVVLVGLIITGLIAHKSKSKNSLPNMDSSIVSVSEDPVGLWNQEVEMIYVDGGLFTMGATTADKIRARGEETPAHTVRLNSYYIGKYEVTQELWKHVMKNNPSVTKAKRHAVDSISWYDAVEFCNKLSEMEGLQKAYSKAGNNISCDFTASGYRLPTEAEWEYAARGGKFSKGYIYSGNNLYFTRIGEYGEVGTSEPNELGLYEMSENMWEWCWDWYGHYNSGVQENPKGPKSGDSRVQRGGGNLSRVAERQDNEPNKKSTYFGLRLARSKLSAN